MHKVVIKMFPNKIILQDIFYYLINVKEQGLYN